MAKDLKRHWRLLSGLTLVTLALGFAMPHLLSPPDLQEKRPLADFPPWPQRPADLAGFRRGIDSYVADRFPARPYLIGWLNRLRLAAGVSGADQVIVGREGWLFRDAGDHLGVARGDPPLPPDEVETWLNTLAQRTTSLHARGAQYVVISAPLKETIYPQFGPWWYAGPDPDRTSVRLGRLAAARQAGVALNLYDAERAAASRGVMTYQRYDTHWTGLGAYEAYRALMNRLHEFGATEGPRPVSDFKPAPRTPWLPRDLALMLGVANMVDVSFSEFESPKDLKVAYLTDRKDWMAARVVDTGQTGKPVLLMTYDSFSNALLPFLYGHFSRLILVHNDFGFWRQDLVDRYRPDVVITEVIESGLQFAMSGPAPDMGPPPPQPPESELFPTEHGQLLHGGPGNDTLIGTRWPDTLTGGRGNDEIHGGPGDDWLSGDRGDDTLWGGPGADTFHSFAQAGVDRVMDFSVQEGDRVLLDPGTHYTVRQQGADTIIDMGGGNQVILVGVKATALHADSIRVGS